jgi:hypothetical protein
MGIGNDTIEM